MPLQCWSCCLKRPVLKGLAAAHAAALLVVLLKCHVLKGFAAARAAAVLVVLLKMPSLKGFKGCTCGGPAARVTKNAKVILGLAVEQAF